ncbi:biotin--[acetyl-CoA-carboxylase] ligase [Natronosporangium hydrolyticum]|uniref:biotin--[acetyl-CoA-carboxylase] ligase n=1 Tax=Natronosporangium hydrolyticum TaxID=2811111 RepID=UPI003B847326
MGDQSADPAGEPATSPRPERPALPSALRAEVLAADRLWTEVTIVGETGSTNADAAAAARRGVPAGLVVIAEYQRAGRGRAGRGWSSPPRAGLALSVLLRPAVPASHWGWLPLLAGVALAESTGRLGAVPARLKWPNDLLIDGRKAAGVLAEVAAGAVVVGIGLNVTNQADELPPHTPPATSLALAGADTLDRPELLRGLLDRFAYWYHRWCRAGGDAEQCGLRPAYRQLCATLSQPVRVQLPDGGELTGHAADIDPAGRLVLRDAAGATQRLAAGDVTHLRPG